MVRSIRVLGPSAALFALFTACGGAADPGLFSGSGGSSTAGATSHAGSGTTPTAGSSAAGSVSTGGDDAMGGDSSAGGSNGGAEAGGAANGGDSSRAGSAGSGEQGGSAGNAEQGGGAGHAEGGSGGHATGGSSAGGAGGAGSGGKAGSGGSAGGSTGPSCKDLLAQAATELEAARACNLAANAAQCTGKVETTCSCQVPVQRNDSAATSAYEDTLKQIQAKHCVQACAAIACAPVIRAQCRPSMPGSNKGMCVASFPVPVGN